MGKGDESDERRAKGTRGSYGMDKERWKEGREGSGEDGVV